jgi:hypothetical protein
MYRAPYNKYIPVLNPNDKQVSIDVTALESLSGTQIHVRDEGFCVLNSDGTYENLVADRLGVQEVKEKYESLLNRDLNVGDVIDDFWEFRSNEDGNYVEDLADLVIRSVSSPSFYDTFYPNVLPSPYSSYSFIPSIDGNFLHTLRDSEEISIVYQIGASFDSVPSSEVNDFLEYLNEERSYSAHLGHTTPYVSGITGEWKLVNSNIMYEIEILLDKTQKNSAPSSFYHNVYIKDLNNTVYSNQYRFLNVIA